MTVGVGIIDSNVTINVPWLQKTASEQKVKLNLRFARDATTNTIIMVWDAPDDDCILVYTSRLDSPTRSTKLTGVFRRNGLREELFRTEQELHISQLLPFLMAFQAESHRRPCAICQQPPDRSCSCTFPRLSPGHPFDSSFFLHGMAQHITVSEAVANKVTFGADGKRCHTVMGARMILQGIVDSELTQRLCSWSVQKHVREIREDPLQSLMLMGSDGDLLQSAEVRDGAGGDATMGTDAGLRNAPQVVDDIHAVSVVSTEADGDLERVEVRREDCTSYATTSGLSSGARHVDGRLQATLQRTESETGYEETGHAWWEEGGDRPESQMMSNRPEQGLAEHFAIHQREVPATRQDMNSEKVRSLSQSSTALRNNDEGPSIACTLPITNLNAVQMTAIQRRTACRIAPAMTLTEVETETEKAPETDRRGENEKEDWNNKASACVPEVTDPDLLERRRRAQIRRERNRAAARRSNQKQKAVRDGLKVELRTAAERLEVLRERELALRKENLLLRKALAGT